MFVWGANEASQLGLGSDKTQSSPVKLSGVPDVAGVACGASHLILQTSSGDLYGCGSNHNHELGFDSQKGNVCFPIVLEFPRSRHAAFVACGFDHTLVLDEDGSLFSFGSNEKGQLGSVEGADIIRLVAVGLPLRAIATRADHCVALARDSNDVYAWGDNSYGQCVGGAERVVAKPTKVAFESAIAIDDIVTGEFHSCLLCANTLYAWGRAEYTGGATSSDGVPAPIETLGSERLLKSKRIISMVSAGLTHTLVLLSSSARDSIVYAFGSNFSGQLGLNHYEDSRVPVRVDSMCYAGVYSIATGYNSSFFATHSTTYKLFACGAGEECGASSSSPDVAPHGSECPYPMCVSQVDGCCVDVYASTFVVVVPSAVAAASVSPAGGLATALGALLSDGILTDAIVKAQHDGASFSVHRAVLAFRLPWLCCRDEDCVVAGMDGKTLEALLLFAYTDACAVEEMPLSDVLPLVLACTNKQTRLRALCERHISKALTDTNVVEVLFQAHALKLPSVKRVCMSFLARRYATAVSDRNTAVVLALSSVPDLLAEVVGMSSPEFASKTLSNLPLPPVLPASTLTFDLNALFEDGSAYSDLTWVCEDGVSYKVHKLVLAARHVDYTPIGDRLTDTSGASSRAVLALIKFLYCDEIPTTLDDDLSLDLLQLCCVYSLGETEMAAKCESALRSCLTSQNALEVLCVSHQLRIEDLKQFTLRFVVDNFVRCALEREDLLSDAVLDFPELAVEMLRSLAVRLRQKQIDL